MKLITEITEADIGITESRIFLESYKLRRSARGIVLNEEGMVVWINVRSNSLHKLPGGGLKRGESVEEGFRREVMEESGCKVEIQKEIGVVLEYRNEFAMLQISYVYVADIIGDIFKPKYTSKELGAGFEMGLEKPEMALKEIQKDKPDDYESKFIQFRENAILAEYLG